MLCILTEALINVISGHISRPDRSKIAVILQNTLRERERELTDNNRMMSQSENLRAERTGSVFAVIE